MLTSEQKDYINSFVKDVYIINLPSRKDRLGNIGKECRKIFNTAFVVPGIRFPDLHCFSGRAGNSAAMTRALQTAYDNKLDNFLLLEDDAYFVDERSPAIYNALKDLETINWDICVFGARIKSKMTDFSKGLYKINTFGCNHCTLYNKKVIGYLLSLLPKWDAGYEVWLDWVIKNECFDIWQSGVLGQNADFYCFSTKELVSLQIANQSDINQVWSDGRLILENDFNKFRP